MAMLFEAFAINQPIGDWILAAVMNMAMFFDAPAFNQPIGGWNNAAVMNACFMFRLVRKWRALARAYRHQQG